MPDALTTAISALSPNQKTWVRDLLVLRDFVDYTKASFLAEDAPASSKTKAALTGSPNELAQILGVSEEKAAKKSGIKPALDKKISANQEMKLVYDALQVKLLNPNSSADLKVVLDELTGQSTLSDSEKEIIRDRLVIDDFLSYTRTSFLNDHPLSSAEVKTALSGNPTSLATLLNEAASDKLKKKSGILPKIETKVEAEAPVQRVFDELSRRLTLPNGNTDLISALCSLEGGTEAWCPAFDAVTPKKAALLPSGKPGKYKAVAVTFENAANIDADRFVAQVVDENNRVVAEALPIIVQDGNVKFSYTPKSAGKLSIRIVAKDNHSLVMVEMKNALELMLYTMQASRDPKKPTTLIITSEFPFKAGRKMRIPLPDSNKTIEFTIENKMLSDGGKKVTVENVK